jgi:catechol 2,3-dioxygenase-like lactoylglutathione lyase family enzyme
MSSPMPDGLFRGINVVSIPVPDLDKGRAFYRDVMGFGQPVYDLPDAGWIEFRLGKDGSGGGGNVSISLAEAGWKPAPGISLVLDVEDCHAACAELRARGIPCDDPEVFPGFVTFCNFYDPFGNRLQMCGPAT